MPEKGFFAFAPFSAIRYTAERYNSTNSSSNAFLSIDYMPEKDFFAFAPFSAIRYTAEKDNGTNSSSNVFSEHRLYPENVFFFFAVSYFGYLTDLRHKAGVPKTKITARTDNRCSVRAVNISRADDKPSARYVYQ